MSENKMTNWFQDEDAIEESEKTGTGEKETSPAPSAETKTDETNTQTAAGEKAETKADNSTADTSKSTKDDEEIPFHKHPRFRALTTENKELKEKLESIEQSMNKFAEKFSQQETDAKPIPEWFVRLYGEDPDLYNAYKKEEETRIASMKDAVLTQLAPKLQEIEKEEEKKKVNNFINSELKAIKEEYPNIDTNAVMKVVYEKKLFDAEGNLNFRAGAEWVLNSTKPSATNEKTEAKKEVAKKLATESGSGEAPKTDIVTAQDLRKTGDWRSFFNSL